MIQHRVEDGIGRIHLDDPDRRNALSKEMSDAIAAAVDSFGTEVGAVVLTAAAPVFCSGGVLDDLISPRAPLGEAYAGMSALSACPVPTIAVVAGAAIGAGVNLPLACDIVIAETSARFDPRFLDVGIHPGGGHYRRLVQRVGLQGAAALSLCGDSLTGEEAASAGLAWRCTADGDGLDLALRLASRATGRDRELVMRAKQTMRTPTTSEAEAFALELEAQQWSVDRPGFIEGVERIRDRIRRTD